MTLIVLIRMFCLWITSRHQSLHIFVSLTLTSVRKFFFVHFITKNSFSQSFIRSKKSISNGMVQKYKEIISKLLNNNFIQEEDSVASSQTL